VKHVEPRFSRSEALGFFERRRFANLWGLLGGRASQQNLAAASPSRQLPFVELVWLPHYIISFRVSSSKGPGTIDVSVEAHSGAFAVFQMHEDLVEGDVEGTVFPPKLSGEEAIESGKRNLLRSILRQRGQWNKPEIHEAVGTDLFYYPFWVYYYERGRGFLDIQVYDAARGEKGGPKTKTGVLSALVGPDEAARKALDKLTG